MVRLTETPFDPGALLADFSRGRRETGAIVSFTGLMRAEDGGAEVLELEAYPGFTEAAIEAMAEDARARHHLQGLVVVHRVGRMAPGEPIVFVAAAARRRREAFEAADQMMDYLKSRAPFWKKSIGPDGERWIEPSARDYEDAARWDSRAPVEEVDAMNAPAPVSAKVVPGGRIDEALVQRPVKIAVLTISDTRDEESDTSGDVLADRIRGAGHVVAARAIVPDDVEKIRAQVRAWADGGEIKVIITTGGTGLTGRDVTPEALEPMFSKKMDGFSVAFHLVSYQSVGTSTLQSRAVAGVVKDVFVFCLPGSNGAVKDGWSVIGPQLDTRHAPCNLVEIMPRLLER